MAIQTNCPHCQTTYNLSDQQAGLTVRCKQCNSPFVVQPLPPMAEEYSAGWEAVTTEPGATGDQIPAAVRNPAAAEAPRNPDRLSPAELARLSQEAPPQGIPWGWVIGGGGTVLFMALAGVALFFFLGRSVAPKPAIPVILPDPWQEFTSAEGHYQVKMPGVPYVTTKDDAKLPQIKVHRATVATDSGHVAYSVLYFDYPEALLRRFSTRQLLDDTKEAVINESEGTLVKESEAFLDRYRGHELELKIKKPIQGTVYLRNYVAGSRLYRLVVAIQEGDEAKVSKADMKKFFDSFHLVEEKANAEKVPLTPEVLKNSFQIINRYSNKVFAVRENRKASGTLIVQAPADAAEPTRLWKMERVDGDWVTIQNVGSGLYLSLEGEGNGAGTQIVIASKRDGSAAASQLWKLTPVENGNEQGWVKVANKGGNLIGVDSNSKQDGARLLLWPEVRDLVNSNQHWKMEPIKK